MGRSPTFLSTHPAFRPRLRRPVGWGRSAASWPVVVPVLPQAHWIVIGAGERGWLGFCPPF